MDYIDSTLTNMFLSSSVNWIFMLVLSSLFFAIAITATIFVNTNKSNKNLLVKDKIYKIGIGVGSILTFAIAIINSAIGGIYQNKLLDLQAQKEAQLQLYTSTSINQKISALTEKFDTISKIFSPVFQFIFALVIFLVLIKFCIDFSKKNDKKIIFNIFMAIGFIVLVAISKFINIISIYSEDKVLFGVIETFLAFGYSILMMFAIVNLIDIIKNKKDKSLSLWKAFFIITIVIIGLFLMYQFMKVLPMLYEMENNINIEMKGKPIKDINKNCSNLVYVYNYIINVKNKYLYTIGFVYMIFINFAPRTLKIEQNKKVLEENDKVIDFFEK